MFYDGLQGNSKNNVSRSELLDENFGIPDKLEGKKLGSWGQLLIIRGAEGSNGDTACPLNDSATDMVESVKCLCLCHIYFQ